MTAPELAYRVSVVIRAFNEERDLPVLLEALQGQTLRDAEILVVDSGSYDRTPELAEAAGARLIRIESDDFTFGYALNVGIKAARGDVVVIVSAHAEPTGPDWLDHLVGPFADPDVAMVYGRQLGDGRSKYAERQDFRARFGEVSHELETDRVFANNANSAIRRSLWKEYLFDEGLTGLEGLAWARHWAGQGKKIHYQADAAVFHIHRESWRQVLHRYYREALAAGGMDHLGAGAKAAVILRESGALVRDVVLFPVRRLPGDALGGVFRFRWEKLRGTLRGFADASSPGSVESPDELYFDRSYRAVCIESAGHARLVDRVTPVLRPSEVLVEVAYVGVNGRDGEVREGTLGYFADGQAGVPFIPGPGLSGRVAAVRPNSAGLALGTRVVVARIQCCGRCAACEADDAIGCDERKEMGVFGMDGGYAGFVVSPARHLHILPDDLSLLDAVFCEPTAVVLKGYRRVEALLGGVGAATVVGAGSIGLLAAQVLTLKGWDVEIVEIFPARQDVARKLGFPVRETLDEKAPGRLIVEATGAATAMAAVLASAGTGAVVLAVGFPYGSRPFNFEGIVASDQAVVGSVGSGGKHFQASLEVLPEMRLAPLRGTVIHLENFQEAWDLHASRAVPKVVLEVMPERPAPKPVGYGGEARTV